MPSPSTTYGNQFLPNGEQFIWNASSIEAFQKCPRYYRYTVIEGWRGSNVHFKFGGLFAGALHQYYLARAKGAEREEAIHACVDWALTQTWENGKPWDSEDGKKNRDNLIRTLVWYFEEYREDLPILYINNSPAAETLLTLDIDDGNVLAGTLDRIVEFDGMAMGMDQKTTGGTLTPRFILDYSPNTQMSTYTFLTQAVLPDTAGGMLIDAVQVAVGFSRFMRAPTYRTKAQLQEYYDQTMRTIEAARAAVRNNQFDMRPSSCNNYGGCMFRKICSESPEIRDRMLPMHFTKGAE